MPITIDTYLAQKAREGDPGLLSLEDEYNKEKTQNPNLTPEMFTAMLQTGMVGKPASFPSADSRVPQLQPPPAAPAPAAMTPAPVTPPPMTVAPPMTARPITGIERNLKGVAPVKAATEAGFALAGQVRSEVDFQTQKKALIQRLVNVPGGSGSLSTQEQHLRDAKNFAEFQQFEKTDIPLGEAIIPGPIQRRISEAAGNLPGPLGTIAKPAAEVVTGMLGNPLIVASLGLGAEGAVLGAAAKGVTAGEALGTFGRTLAGGVAGGVAGQAAVENLPIPAGVAPFVPFAAGLVGGGLAAKPQVAETAIKAGTEAVGKAAPAVGEALVGPIGERGALGKVPPEVPPTPVEPPAPQVPPTLAEKMANTIRTAKRIQQSAEVLKHEAHARQAAGILDVLQSPKYTDAEAFQIASGLRKGEIVPKSFDIPEGTFSPVELAQGDAAIRYFDWGGKPFDALNARVAFLKATSGIKPYPYEIGLLERVFGSDVAKSLTGKQPLGGKVLGVLGDLLFEVPRTMQTMWDFSAQLRQLAILTPRHPVETLGNMWGANILPFFSGTRAAEIDAALRKMPADLTEEGAQAGWQKIFHAEQGPTAGLNAREELMASHLLIEGVKIKGVTLRVPGGKESARAFTSIVNKARKDIYTTVAKSWQGTGKTAEDYLGLADLINKGSGRGNLPEIMSTAGIGKIFYAPRLWLGRIQHPLMMFSKSPSVRMMAAQQFVAFVGTNMAILGLLKASGAAEVELNPLSTDWGKARVGPMRFDPWGGMQPIARAVVQFAAGHRKAAAGQITPVNRLTVALRAGQSKLNPGLGTIVDLAAGTTFVGEELSASPSAIRTQIYNRLTPLFVQDMVDAIQQQGLLGGILAVPGVFGVGVQTYQTPYDRLTQTENQILGEIGYSRKDMENNPGIQAQVRQDPRWQEQRKSIDADAKAHGVPVEYRFGSFSRETHDTMKLAQGTDDQRLLNWWKGAEGAISPQEWLNRQADRSAESFNRIDAVKNALGVTFEEDKAIPGTVREALDKYYAVDIADFTDAGTGNVDWASFKTARDATLVALSPEDQTWAQKAIHQYDTPLQAEYRQDEPSIESYYNVGPALWSQIAPKKAPLETLIQMEQQKLSKALPNQDITRAEAITQLSIDMPEVGQYYKELAGTQYNYRWDNPQNEATDYKWGIVDKILSPKAAEFYHSWFGRWPDDFAQPPAAYKGQSYVRPD